jgi:DNA-binding beta-propeller fold protein YncE
MHMRWLMTIMVAALATAAAAQSLVVVNQGSATASVIDATSLAVVGTITPHLPGKDRAHEVAISPDGRTAYLPVYGDSGVGLPGSDGRTLLIVDIASRSIVGEVDFGRGVRPHLPVVDPKRGLLYVTTELDNSVAIIDPRARAVVGHIPTGADQSHMLALSPDGRTGYTANVGPGSVSVLDMVAHKTLAVIKVADHVQRIAVSTDGGQVFTSDTQAPRLAVIDTNSRSVKQWVPLPGLGRGAAAMSDGRRLLVITRNPDVVAVVDLKKMQVVETIPVGKGPQTIVVQPDQRRAFVTCAGDGTVAVIDLARQRVVRTIATAAGADGLAWAQR